MVLRRVLIGATVAGALATGFIPGAQQMLAQSISGTDAPQIAAPSPEAQALIEAARAQVGVTLTYDPAYVRLDYPGGDVPRDRGVCTDVLIRALRDAFDIDLQIAVHRDMKADFAAYPKGWGLKSTDRNIDHRRVPNLETYLTRMGAALSPGTRGADYAPGDVVTAVFPDGQTHVMIVTDQLSADGSRPLIVHNVGAGTRIEDRLFEWKITGQFRLSPGVLAVIRARTA